MSGYPTYPEDFWMPPRPRVSIKYGYVGWLWIEYYLHGATRGELASRTIDAWMGLPWPSDRVAVAAFVLVVLWLVGGGVWRGAVSR